MRYLSLYSVLRLLQGIGFGRLYVLSPISKLKAWVLKLAKVATLAGSADKTAFPAIGAGPSAPERGEAGNERK